MSNARFFIQQPVVLLALGAGILSCTGRSETPRHPNVVIFLSDDQGWGDFSITVNSNLQTPNIDRLATEGVLFTRFFVCPVCSPTRAELLTGRYHTRNGVHDTSLGGERLNLGETTIAEVFKKAGYATAAFGKWHNGMQYPYHPNARGFDEFYGFCSGHWGDYFSPVLEHNGRITRGTGYLTDDLTSRAMDFMELHRHQPFFVYIPYNTPHSPMQVPDEWWEKYKDKEIMMRGTRAEQEDIEFTRAALAMVENIDWNVGRVLQKLRELSLDENTIVLYFNDNGPNAHRWNNGFKGIKGSVDEGGVITPLFLRWPAGIKPGKRVDTIAGAIDLLPTLASLAGIEAATVNPPDGMDLKPLLAGDTPEWPDRVIFSHWKGRISARTQKYRYDQAGRLYDMESDPGQLSDVAGEHPDVAAWFSDQVNRWKTETFSGMDEDTRPFPVGHPDFRYTQLPARDGRPHGGIERSNRSPNSTYFTNWTATSDSITWDAEVLADGKFEVEIYYTCPAADTGSAIQLSFLGNHLTAVVSEPNDPPLRGMEHDRILRTQSYVKDFKPLKAGVIHLEKGRGLLTLKALDIPGGQVMDFRKMMLTRVE